MRASVKPRMHKEIAFVTERKLRSIRAWDGRAWWSGVPLDESSEDVGDENIEDTLRVMPPSEVVEWLLDWRTDAATPRVWHRRQRRRWAVARLRQCAQCGRKFCAGPTRQIYCIDCGTPAARQARSRARRKITT